MTYDGLKIFGFSMISHFLDRILMEHIEPICSLESKLTFISICSTGIRSRTRDIVKNRRIIKIFENNSISRTNSNSSEVFVFRNYMKFWMKNP